MSEVRIVKKSQKVYAVTPFKADFLAAARSIGGRWTGDKKTGWEFPAEIEDRVRKLVIEHYGHDGTPQETADVKIRVLNAWRDVGREYWRFGRKLLWRSGRDWPVGIDDSVTVLEGSFRSSGGSRKNPLITMTEESVLLLVKDVPLSAIDQDDGEYAVVSETKEPETFTVTLPVEKVAFLKETLELDRETIILAAIAFYESHVRSNL